MFARDRIDKSGGPVPITSGEKTVVSHTEGLEVSSELGAQICYQNSGADRGPEQLKTLVCNLNGAYIPFWFT